MKHEIKPLPMNFPDPVQCSYVDKSASQPRRNAAVGGGTDVTAGPPRKWKRRHINRHFSSTSDHPTETTHHAESTAAKAYPSPSWLVAEQPIPLSSVCHQGLPVVKKGSPLPELSRRFLPESTDVGHMAPSTLDVERAAMLRKRRHDDRHDTIIPFAMSPNVAKFPAAFNYGITPVDIVAGYLILSLFFSLSTEFLYQLAGSLLC